jgi:hypothetical protein
MPDALTCAAFDGTRTRLSRISIVSGSILPLAILQGRFTAYSIHGSAGWLTGWRDRSAIAIRLDTMNAFELPPAGGRYVSSMSGSRDRVAAIESNGDQFTLAVYPLAAGTTVAAK